MDFSKSKIQYIITHEVGNKLRDEKLFLSNEIQAIDEKIEELLLTYFFKSFDSNQDKLSFKHNSNLELNEIYTYSQKIFNESSVDNFIESSKHIAKHLYEFSLHPKIIKGELIVVKLVNIIYNNKYIDVIGIFKSEKKESFLKILKKDEKINIKDDEGINISKVEKGCLVLNDNMNDGYVVLNVDNQSQFSDYWSNKFLNVRPLKNNNYKTKELIKICKNFSNEVLSSKYDTNIKFTFNNDYIDYFENNDSYDVESFASSTFKNDEIRKDFFEYQDSNKNMFDIDIHDKFELSQYDIKKEKKKIKNVIKLDTKLELKVLLDKENGTKNIEKGFDEDKGMSYYKIYFNEEIK